MGKQAAKAILNPSQLRQLQRIAGRRTSSVRDIERARIVLLAASGLTNDAIARELNLCRPTVALWRKRFLEEGLPGLKDEPGRGRQAVYTEDDHRRVVDIRRVEKPPLTIF